VYIAHGGINNRRECLGERGIAAYEGRGKESDWLRHFRIQMRTVQGEEKLLVKLLPVDSTRRDRQHCIINMVPQN